ncbi:MAG: hypothetical protein JW993_01625 [Sedimentisphaerales bacterium]|nr:hypothetical protein [Sedimentisphaerales bacterium]
MQTVRALTLSLALTAGGITPAHAQEVTLETLRQQVARNEALIDPIKLDYTVKIVRTEERRPVAMGGRRAGRSFSHYDVTWAQKGSMQYVRVQYFYGPNEAARWSQTVFDDDTRAYIYSPQPQHVSVGPTRNTDWSDALTAKLRLRPFEDHQWLSEALVPLYATLHPDMESVGGRPAHVVDLVRPDRPTTVERVWIDAQSSIPIRTRLYDGHPDAPHTRLLVEVKGVTPHKLPNGGWIPISGVRTITASEHVSVDVNSITTQVPASLFRLDPPEGGTIYNVSTRLTSIAGGTTKSYEQIVSSGGKFIAGAVTDTSGTPLAGVVVAPARVTTERADGRSLTRLVQPYERTCAVTDPQGRFALECEEEGEYNLSFHRAGFVEARANAVPAGEPGLKVILEEGGTLSGRVFFANGAQKVLLGDARIYASAGDSFLAPGVPVSPEETRTDEQGRFELTGLAVRLRDRSNRSSEPARYVPVPWEIRCGLTSQTVTFDAPGDRREIELVLKPNVKAAAPLVSKPLPSLAGLGLDVTATDIDGRRVLVCFFDMEQRPARRCVLELAEQAKLLAEKGVAVLTVHEKGVDAAQLRAWADESGVTFPVGAIAGDPDIQKFTWAVRSLPWLILTDANHVVTAEGFSVAEIGEQIR